MGGTSTDVCHYNGEYERTLETEVTGVRLKSPMMLINTVAAGGGSILHYDGSRYRVGPESAGAFPGPACYRNGGPLTVTDCNVMLGKLNPDYFPKVFGPNGNQNLTSKLFKENLSLWPMIFHQAPRKLLPRIRSQRAFYPLRLIACQMRSKKYQFSVAMMSATIRSLVLVELADNTLAW